MSQSALAARVGLTSQTISLYERGRIKPGAPSALRLADVLKLDVRDLVESELPETSTDAG